MAYRFVILAAVLLLNGFFATAEVALVSVRKSRITRVGRGRTRVRASGAHSACQSIAAASMTQAGVTLASLGLGWAGENKRLPVARVGVSSAHTASLRIPVARPEFRPGFPAHQLCAYRFWRGGAQESCARKGRPHGGPWSRPLSWFFPACRRRSHFSRKPRPGPFHAGSACAGGHGGGGHSAEELKFIIMLQPHRRASASL